jgi:hypothetical protein
MKHMTGHNTRIILDLLEGRLYRYTSTVGRRQKLTKSLRLGKISGPRLQGLLNTLIVAEQCFDVGLSSCSYDLHYAMDWPVRIKPALVHLNNSPKLFPDVYKNPVSSAGELILLSKLPER